MLFRKFRLSRPEREFLKTIRALTGFKPRNLGLYQQAFRHKSAIKDVNNAMVESNERLEYLGDAVLDTVVANYLYLKFPNRGEGFLTKMRAKIVSRKCLNEMALKLGINHMIQANLEHGAHGTSVNGNALEALIGAVSLDRGFEDASTFVCQQIILKHMNMNELLEQENDFKSKLIEWGQKNKQSIQFTVQESQPKGSEKQYLANASVGGKELGSGVGPSKKKAEQLAAEAACKHLF